MSGRRVVFAHAWITMLLLLLWAASVPAQLSDAELKQAAAMSGLSESEIRARYARETVKQEDSTPPGRQTLPEESLNTEAQVILPLSNVIEDEMTELAEALSAKVESSSPSSPARTKADGRRR